MQRSEFQHYREKFGTARSIDAFEDISAEIKALLLVSGQSNVLHCTYVSPLCVCACACACACVCVCVYVCVCVLACLLA